jgi:hypothetical protein
LAPPSSAHTPQDANAIGSNTPSLLFSPPRQASSQSFSFVTRPRFLYAAVFVWISVTGGRFLAPFLRHQAGLDDGQIGTVLALQTLLTTLTGGYGGAWADRREMMYPHRGRAQVLGVGVTMGTISFVLHSGINWNISTSRSGSRINDDGDEGNDHKYERYLHYALQCGFALATSLVFPVLDGMCLAYLQAAALPKQAYGRERLYGAITWAVTNLCLAPLLDCIGFVILYWLSCLSCLAVLVSIVVYVQAQQQVSRQLLKQKSQNIAVEEVTHDEDDEFWGGRDRIRDSPTDIGNTFADADNSHCSQSSSGLHTASTADRRLTTIQLCRSLYGTTFGFAFLVAVLSLASGQAIVDSLSFLYFETLGSSYMTMGFMILLTVAFEIPIFHVAPKLLEYAGAGGLLLLGGACYVTRTIGYSFIPQGKVGWVLWLEPLHGITYACSQTATVDFVAQLLPDAGYEATGQGLVSVTRGVGSMLGLWLGGTAQNIFGARIVYRIASAVVLTGSSIFALTLLGMTHSVTHVSRSHYMLSQLDGDDDLDVGKSDLELTAVQSNDDSSSQSEEKNSVGYSK